MRANQYIRIMVRYGFGGRGGGGGGGLAGGEGGGDFIQSVTIMCVYMLSISRSKEHIYVYRNLSYAVHTHTYVTESV